MKKNITFVAIGLVVLVTTAPYLINHLVSSKITEQLDKSLAQSAAYRSMDAAYFDDTIVFHDLVLHDNDKPESRFNVQAKQLKLHVDYHNALLKDFQVKRITADGVKLNLTYQGRGESNVHRLQQNLRHYLNNRPKRAENEKATWDVYDMVLNNITVNIQDEELGDVGTFLIPKLVLPHVSSTYSKQSNRDTLLLALTKELGKQMFAGTLKGEYNKMKALQFAKRELSNEAGKTGETLKEAAISKAKSLASGLLQKMKEKQPQP